MKTKLIQHPDEFYIGYLAQAPTITSGVIKTTVIILGLIITLVCVLIVSHQRKFSSAIFEFGTVTEVEGVLSLEPVPNLRVSEGGSVQRIVLVGFGKMGALKTIEALEQQSGKTLAGKRIKLNGTRIYGDGKGLLQITPEDNVNLVINAADESETITEETRSELVTLVGEIVDPKCYFGVMKPGEGKPHRSCAIRCISGGIPPVLAARGEKIEYVILTGDNINQAILPFVGEPVQLAGTIVEYDDWKVMRVNMDNLKTLVQADTRERLMAQDEGMTICASNLN